MIGRMLLGLGLVLGLMWLIARYAKRPLGGRPDGVLSVLARQQLTKGSSVAVVKLLDRALVVGVSDQGGVQLLTETELEPLEVALTVPERRKLLKPRSGEPSAAAADTVEPTELNAENTDHATDRSATTERRGALDGSILSRKTWSQLIDAARDATVRR